MVELLYIIVGLVVLFAGAHGFVRGVASVARAQGVSPVVIGLTLVAIGTSFPEIMVSSIAAVKNNPPIALGNILGSNITNTLLILGLCALLCPLPIDKRVKNGDVMVLLAVTLVFSLLACFGYLGMMEAAILLAMMLVFVTYLFKTSGKLAHAKREAELSEDYATLPMSQSALWIAAGCAAMWLGSDVVVDHSIALAKVSGITEIGIGMTLVALGTSLPELVTSVIAARKRQPDLVMGTVIGSNIVNIVAGVGIPAMLHDMEVSQDILYVDVVLNGVVTLALVILLRYRNELSKKAGLVSLLLYVIFVMYECNRMPL